MADGRTEKYYVELPSSIGEVKWQFSNFPPADDPELAKRDIEDLCTLYIAKLAELVAQARKNFLPDLASNGSAPRSRTHLRLVK
ncbi:hypothetical protein D3C85_1822610 [compost metagenome]